MTASADENLFPGWKRVVPPPPGYFHVLRRSFGSGLHVLILVLKRDEGYMVKSCVDQNTLRGMVKCEGDVSTFPEVIELIRTTTNQWGKPLHIDTPAKTLPPRQLYYADTAGNMVGPVTREELFEFLGTGQISWDTQAWNGFGWTPIIQLLGFPPVP